MSHLIMNHTFFGIGEMISVTSIWLRLSANVAYGSVFFLYTSFVCCCCWVSNCTVKFGKLPVQRFELWLDERVDDETDGGVWSLLDDSPSERRSGTLTPWTKRGFWIGGVGNFGMVLQNRNEIYFTRRK
jgi:hypothetical protein